LFEFIGFESWSHHNYKQMIAFFENYSQAYSDITSQTSIGESIEGRKIYSFEVSEDAGIPKEGRHQVLSFLKFSDSILSLRPAYNYFTWKDWDKCLAKRKIGCTFINFSRTMDNETFFHILF
jgi:hypothetical protein